MITPGGPTVNGYRDLANLLRQQITSGRLPPGHALPSERALRETYGLGKHTVRQALAQLRHEGLIVVRRGYGALVREPANRETITLPPGCVLTARMPTPQEIADLDLGEGVPVLHLACPDGTGDVYPADRVQITVAC